MHAQVAEIFWLNLNWEKKFVNANLLICKPPAWIGVHSGEVVLLGVVLSAGPWGTYRKWRTLYSSPAWSWKLIFVLSTDRGTEELFPSKTLWNLDFKQYKLEVQTWGEWRSFISHWTLWKFKGSQYNLASWWFYRPQGPRETACRQERVFSCRCWHIWSGRSRKLEVASIYSVWIFPCVLVGDTLGTEHEEIGRSGL